LDLVIPVGRSLAIVGQNGAGKTTLVKLLARLYDPAAGRILIDGVDLRDMSPNEWQRRIGAIFQDFVHYELAAADNVAFGSPERPVDVASLDRAADRAGAIDVLDEGRVVEAGTHDELMAAGGKYAHMFTLQAARFVEAGDGRGDGHA